jgi:hypothetical protein
MRGRGDGWVGGWREEGKEEGRDLPAPTASMEGMGRRSGPARRSVVGGREGGRGR